MRKQIAAANWKMNMTYQQGEKLLDDILQEKIDLDFDQQVIFAVPFPYLIMATSVVADERGYSISAQNCSDKKSGAYTGEVSAEMLQSIGIPYCVIGHSERREYFLENNKVLAEKVNICLQNEITPIFCCGEPLRIREENNQDQFVQQQLEESLFHLSPEQIKTIIIAYEPIWAIGTGDTCAANEEKSVIGLIRRKLDNTEITIQYGGSVKPDNIDEIMAQPEIDCVLVVGASLDPAVFAIIVNYQ